jgi:hypothetical protein
MRSHLKGVYRRPFLGWRNGLCFHPMEPMGVPSLAHQLPFGAHSQVTQASAERAARARRSGSTDTITSADLSLRKDDINA